MGIFDFDETSNTWNYSDPSKPGYSPTLEGTVVQIDEVQEYDYMTRLPKTFENGNPRTNIKCTILTDAGEEVPWTFNPYKKGAAFVAVMNATRAYNPQATGFKDIGGLRVKITTQGTTQELGKNARPWWFEIKGPGSAPFRGLNKFNPQTQQQPQPQVTQPQQYQQPQMQQAAPPIQGGYFAPPMPQQQPMQQAQPQPGDWVPQAQPAQQQPQHQVIQGYPQLIPDGNGGQIYDQDIPF